ncbi:MAG: glycosyltransferase family 4 protein [Phycisphaerales bacterium]
MSEAVPTTPNRPTVLCFVDYYLPGYKAGGPTRTIINLVAGLGDEVDFRIVTRDRDMGSDQPYTGVAIDAWNSVGKAQVFYASPSTFSFSGIRRLISTTPHDIVYLNSFLSPRTTGLVLLLRRLGLTRGRPVILAPRGEFADSALALKARKKRAYLAVTRLIGLYRGLIWQATSDHEATDIRRRQSGVAKRILQAPNLLPPPRERADTEAPRADGPLRLVFLSRIAPMKNLDFLLRALAQVKVELSLTLHGTRETEAYWAECEQLISALPPNIRVRYEGPVTPDQVPAAFGAHDLFVFPTRGENFGHVIFESLSSGTPVMVSDKTPWRDDPAGAVEVVPITDTAAWAEAITRWSSFDPTVLAARRAAASAFAAHYLATSPAAEQHRALFRAALDR